MVKNGIGNLLFSTPKIGVESTIFRTFEIKIHILPLLAQSVKIEKTIRILHHFLKIFFWHNWIPNYPISLILASDYSLDFSL